MSSDNPPAAPKDQFANTMGPAVNNAFTGIQQFSGQPNLPMQDYTNASGAFGGPTFSNSGYDPRHTVQAGYGMTGQAQSLSPYVSQIFQQGFDPQNEFYGRAAHNLTEQTRAGLNDRGLTMTPYGAGVEANALGNFNIDWNNSQLGRAATGLQAGAGLNDSINRGITGGENLAQGAGTWQSQIAQMLSQLGLNTQQGPQQAIMDWLAFTGQGGQSANNRYQAQFQNYDAKQHADDAMWSGIGQLAGSASSAAMFASDRDLKYDVGPIDDLLADKIVELPISSWRYNWESTDMPRHIGPMAQDLKSSFGIGTGRAVHTVDGVGLSLAVSKALAKKVKRLERRAA